MRQESGTLLKHMEIICLHIFYTYVYAKKVNNIVFIKIGMGLSDSFPRYPSPFSNIEFKSFKFRVILSGTLYTDMPCGEIRLDFLSDVHKLCKFYKYYIFILHVL